MKNIRLICLFLVCSFALISWGVAGHRTVGAIAANHLTPKTRAAVIDLLGDQTLADVSTWADDVRNQPEYKQTAPWHYLDLPTGLSYDVFKAQVLSSGGNNVYGAIARCEQELLDSKTPKEKKIEDLKFIVHFIGDLHQPMHISRAEDKGGNTIQVNFNGNGTNLHALWDSGLIDRQLLSYQQMAEQYDHLNKDEIFQLQHAPMITWMWESYQISSKLYAEVAAMKTRAIGDPYYTAHIDIVQQRLEMAGIRLAGVLNEIFDDGKADGQVIPPPLVAANMAATDSAASAAPVDVPANEVSKYLNKMVNTSGTVVSTRLIPSNNMTLLNVNGDSPNQDFTIVITSSDRPKFGQPEVSLMGKKVSITGMVTDYKGKPEIFLNDPAKLKVQ